MFNLINKKPHDPEAEFNGVWLNTESGALYIWHLKPLCIGFSKEGRMLNVDVFEYEFVHTPVANRQKYHVGRDYNKVPLMVLAKIENKDYEGSDLEIYFGSLYGTVSPEEEFVIVNQLGNVEIGAMLEFGCKPMKGALGVKLFLIGYE